MTRRGVDTFALRFEPSGENAFQLRAESSTQGETGALVELDLDALEEDRADPASSGQRLFNAVFQDGVRDLWNRALAGNGRVRLQLKMDLNQARTARLFGLPWELLHDGRDFLALTGRVCVVRRVDVDRPLKPIVLRPPLKVLAFSCSPKELEPLDLEGALAAIKSGLAETSQVVVTTVEGGFDDLAVALEQDQYHVLHFIGHGAFLSRQDQGVLLFGRRGEAAQQVDGNRLAQLLGTYPQLGLVVLDACQTAQSGLSPFRGVAAALIKAGLPAVMAMRARIRDTAAACFGKHFYRELAATLSLDRAVDAARLAMNQTLDQDGAWSTPVLFMRSRESGLEGARDQDMLFTRPMPMWPFTLVAAAMALFLVGLQLKLLFIPGPVKIYVAPFSPKQGALNGMPNRLLAGARNELYGLLQEVQTKASTKPPFQMMYQMEDQLPLGYRNNVDVVIDGEINENLAQPVTLFPSLADGVSQSPLVVPAREPLDYETAVIYYRELVAAVLRASNVQVKDPSQLDQMFAGKEEAVRAGIKGGQLLREGRAEEALASYQKAVNIEATYAPAHNNLGALLEAYGNLEGAIQSYRKAAGLRPELPIYRYNLAHALRISGDTQSHAELLENLKHVVSLRPHLGRAYNEMGLHFMGRKDWWHAALELRLGVDKDPNYPPLYANLGEVLVHLEKPQEALPYFKVVLEGAPGDPSIQGSKEECQAAFFKLRALNMLARWTEAQNAYQALEALDQCRVFISPDEIEAEARHLANKGAPDSGEAP